MKLLNFRNVCIILKLILEDNYVRHKLYFFLRKARGWSLLTPLAFGITINLTAFFDVLFFKGFVANKLKSSSLSTKCVSFYSNWID